ncbi:cytochrome c oxidase assembly protein COX11, mitochondrial [Nilaparvata lugens]|uniref:cytochrome c oxidase assembly protein COX11, mitochondrial n=1 Tax=Nilaparvata lugens TaxID=108931 RepID=UPI00193E0B76|nr:cytochrome c oxidase assembly protein COX11, mitochondrial [Nilaparvata lugens]
MFNLTVKLRSISPCIRYYSSFNKPKSSRTHRLGLESYLNRYELCRTECVKSMCCRRLLHNNSKSKESENKSIVYYLSAIGVLTLGLSYAAVPLYRIFCQASGYGGTVGEEKDTDVSKMKKVKDREITIKFNADVSSSLKWNFHPQQSEITVAPGETALAFYTAENPADKPVIGVSTYNVVPFEAGQYFNKIQCFCFEEQMLNPHEQVDMPVFFYIDPEYSEDPKLEYTDTIILSYTFFEVKDGMSLPLPGYFKPHTA